MRRYDLDGDDAYMVELEEVEAIKAELPDYTASRMIPECEYRGGVCHDPKSSWRKCKKSPHYTEGAS